MDQTTRERSPGPRDRWPVTPGMGSPSHSPHTCSKTMYSLFIINVLERLKIVLQQEESAQDAVLEVVSLLIQHRLLNCDYCP